MAKIKIMQELPHQTGPLTSSARYKIWPWGRRAGKTRAAFIASTIGHGAQPNGKGMLTGGHVLWIARDYTQARTIWYKEIKKRFLNVTGVEVSEKYRSVTLTDHSGSLRVASADNIDSERGDAWDGVVIDEAAHVDLKYIIGQVIRPGLADTKGWLIVMSTTKPSSYFNELCQQVEDGERAGWELTERTALDNDKIDDEEFNLMVEEYGTDEVALQCEVYANRTVAGGYAFREWNDAVHVAKVTGISDTWPGVATMDWGYVQPGWFGYARIGPEGQVYFRYDLKFSGTEPVEVGKRIGARIKAHTLLDEADYQPVPMYIVADAQMWMKSESAITVADQVQAGLRESMGDLAPTLIPAIKGPESRTIGKVLVHQHLQYDADKVFDEDGKIRTQHVPRLRFHPDCEYPIHGFPRLPLDEHKLEDVNTKADDHFYDGVRYLLLMQKPHVEEKRPVLRRHADMRIKARRDRLKKALNTPTYSESEADVMGTLEPGDFWAFEHEHHP